MWEKNISTSLVAGLGFSFKFSYEVDIDIESCPARKWWRRLESRMGRSLWWLGSLRKPVLFKLETNVALVNDSFDNQYKWKKIGRYYYKRCPVLNMGTVKQSLVTLWQFADWSWLSQVDISAAVFQWMQRVISWELFCSTVPQIWLIQRLCLVTMGKWISQ